MSKFMNDSQITKEEYDLVEKIPKRKLFSVFVLFNILSI